MTVTTPLSSVEDVRTVAVAGKKYQIQTFEGTVTASSSITAIAALSGYTIVVIGYVAAALSKQTFFHFNDDHSNKGCYGSVFDTVVCTYPREYYAAKYNDSCYFINDGLFDMSIRIWYIYRIN